MAVITTIQHRRDTAANWTSTNPTLAAGELGFETDTQKVKIGDGSTAWTSLAYIADNDVENVASLVTLTGVSAGDTDLGTFTGSTISDTNTIKGALQEIETAVDAVASGVTFQGDWDASSGSFPGGGTAQTGYLYVISVAGTVDSISFTVGDQIYARTDNASTSTYAANWVKVDSVSEVTSVAGQTGVVTLDTDDVSEATALYFTNARAIAAPITGFTSGAGTVAATDTLLQAINKLDGNIAANQADVVTTRGDIVRGDASGDAERLAIGASGTFLKSDGTDVSWSNVVDGGSA